MKFANTRPNLRLAKVATLILSACIGLALARPAPPVLIGTPSVPPPVPGPSVGSSSLRAVAFDFTHVVQENKGKYFTFATYNDDISYEFLDAADAPNYRWSTRWKQYRWGDQNKAAFSSFTIETLPTHGSVYLIDVDTSAVTPITQNGTRVADPDELYYRPDLGFTGSDTLTYSGTDRTGKSDLGTVTFDVFAAVDYPMPYGIPQPGFGIEEEPPVDPAGWQNGPVPGNFYVDKDAANCLDNSNGWPGQPRCSLPPHNATVAAGGKFVLRPASSCYAIRKGFHSLTLKGTKENPAWFVGDDRGPAKPVVCPRADDTGTVPALRLDGSYARLSGVVFDDVSLTWWYNNGSGALGVDENVVYRFLDMKNWRSPSNGTGVSTGGVARDFLFYAGHVHDNAGWDDQELYEHDFHGFSAASVTGQWMIDIMCTEVTGDCYQSSHSGDVDPDQIYMGRWVAHDFGENCVNTKPFHNSVISESDCWSTRAANWKGSSGSNGQLIVAGDENENNQKGFLYFLNNRVWDTNGSGLADQTVPTTARTYWIGNRIGHIKQPTGVANPLDSLSGIAIASSTALSNRHFYFNSVHDAVYGMYSYNSGGVNSPARRHFIGNAFSDVAYGFRKLGGLSKSPGMIIDWNVYSGAEQPIVAGGNPPHPQYPRPTLYPGVASLGGVFEANGLDGLDPRFIGADKLDMRLMANSPLIDALPENITEQVPEMARIFTDLPWINNQTPIFDYLRKHQGARLDIGAAER